MSTVQVVPGVKYTFAQLERIRSQVDASGWMAKGYVWRQDMDGTVMLVPWHQASGGGGGFGGPLEKGQRVYTSQADDPFDEASLPPIVKRTPQQRVDSLMLKVLEDVKAGRVLTEAQIKEIVGVAWQDGRTEITGEVVKMVAQSFLEKAEKEREEHHRHLVTRD